MWIQIVGMSDMGLKSIMLIMTAKLRNSINNICKRWNNNIWMEILELKHTTAKIKILVDGFLEQILYRFKKLIK